MRILDKIMGIHRLKKFLFLFCTYKMADISAKNGEKME